MSGIFQLDGLGVQLLRRAFSAYVLVAVVVTALQLWSEYDITRERVDSEIRYQQSVFAEPLENAVWHLDGVQIDSIVAGIIRSPVVSGVSLVDLDGKWIYRAGMLDLREQALESAGLLIERAQGDGLTFEPELLHYQLTLYENQPQLAESDSPEPLAIVHFYLDHEVVMDEVRQSLLVIVLVAVVKTAALWLIFLLFINKIISLPLAALNRRFLALSPSNPLTAEAAAAVEIAPGEADELVCLKRAINDLAEARQLEERYKQELGALNRTLEQQIRQRTEELRIEHQSIQAIIESMDEGLLVLDAEGDIERVNPKLEQMVGQDAEALQGGALQQLFVAGAGISTLLQRLQQEQSVDERHELIPRQGGEHRPVQLSASLLRRESNEVAGAVVVVHDLSERLRMEQREQYLAYQSGISETGAEVMHTMGNAFNKLVGRLENLQRSSGYLQRVSEAVERLLERYSSKEIDAQGMYEALQAIASTLTRISQREGAEEWSLYATLERLNGDVNDIKRLLHSYRETAQMRFEPVRFHLPDLFEDVRTQISGDLQQHEVELRFECPQGLMMEQNRNSMLQMMVNLLDNSVEAVVERKSRAADSAGQIQVTVVQIGEGRVVITVEDNGCGMEPELQQKIFQMGFTTKTFGSGLGIHAVGNFISKLGGEISFHSDGRDHGAVVRMEMPIRFGELQGETGTR
jgi:PAS domain S-box-containing protein